MHWDAARKPETTAGGRSTCQTGAFWKANENDAFAGRLKVETGYHSHHMNPSAATCKADRTYLQAALARRLRCAGRHSVSRRRLPYICLAIETSKQLAASSANNHKLDLSPNLGQRHVVHTVLQYTSFDDHVSIMSYMEKVLV